MVTVTKKKTLQKLDNYSTYAEFSLQASVPGQVNFSVYQCLKEASYYRDKEQTF